MRGGAIELYTSHWRSALLSDDVDAAIIGVSRGTPRRSPGFRYRLLRSLAPDDHTWAQENQEDFEQSYIGQLEELGTDRVLEDLGRISEEHGGKPLILLCWERPHEEYCHRWTLSRWLEKRTGLVVPELTRSMLGKKPDAQPTLFGELPREERA